MHTPTPFTVVLVAAGVGTRMGAEIPKQYLPVGGKPLVHYCLERFLSMPEVEQIVVVCDPAYRHFFNVEEGSIPVSFADPGIRRQDSVFNGIANLTGNPLVCIHDGVRPFITVGHIRATVHMAAEYGAAVLGVPVKSTIKVCDTHHFVKATPERAHLWEVQTPQVLRLDILKEGFRHAEAHHLTVTDDVSLAEAIGHSVKVVEGSYTNIKITTQDDLAVAEQFLKAHAYL